MFIYSSALWKTCFAVINIMPVLNLMKKIEDGSVCFIKISSYSHLLMCM